MKFGEHFRLMLKEKNPSKLAEIINEAYIIIVATNRRWHRTPHIVKH
jgi:hypothetical protein